ncbi:N-acetylglucosaminyl-phosphatidylinositol de-N-acetylase isoform X2 [Gasterosteus aculeatus]|uniref:N-acetylglucosaminylphosphatidylinositol deacetylase n=1 Tax=Gasterosteus aculeatus aculeatus TaxID=481459 RepID=A0AAQ4P7W8_GASAC|nr:N-acetylglucosaminyl-phosphatidylinositol de-N-acetylase isoform X3 [Gasterosteus aculeatus aculeatus]
MFPGQVYVSIVDCKSAGSELWTTGQTEGCAAFVGRCPGRRPTLVKSLKRAINVLTSREINGDDISALLVTAHPDDECMFFAPTIIRLVELKANVHLLCLSEGNYYNQGAQRRQELLNSCAVLGIPDCRITIVDHKKLPDDPKAEWSVSLVSSVIVHHMRAHSFNMVLTFDESGVSSHANHTAIHKALRHLAFSGQVPNDCCLLSLVTVGPLRKYISFLELPFSWLQPACLRCIIGSQGYRRAKDAMFCHRSQLLWFRYLYITFSRYMFVNTFQTIPQGPKNLKMY